LTSHHTRKHSETLARQAHELPELSRNVATDTAEPLKTSASKEFKPAA
jgi:hypothetical protein